MIGNLCRCSAYPEIIDAVKLAATRLSAAPADAVRRPVNEAVEMANKDLRDWIAAVKAIGELKVIKAPSLRRRSAASSISTCARWATPQ